MRQAKLQEQLHDTCDPLLARTIQALKLILPPFSSAQLREMRDLPTPVNLRLGQDLSANRLLAWPQSLDESLPSLLADSQIGRDDVRVSTKA